MVIEPLKEPLKAQQLVPEHLFHGIRHLWPVLWKAKGAFSHGAFHPIEGGGLLIRFGVQGLGLGLGAWGLGFRV